MDKETEQFMLAQFKDVLEEVKRLLDICDIIGASKYIDTQVESIKSKFKKEPSVSDNESENR